MVATTVPVAPFDLIVFGGTGDLARRKLLPGLFHRFRAGQAPSEARIIGAARADMDRTGFQAHTRAAIEEFVDADDRPADQVDAFLGMIEFEARRTLFGIGPCHAPKQPQNHADRRDRRAYLGL